MDGTEQADSTDTVLHLAVPAPGITVAALFREHHRRLVGLAFLLVGDSQAAEDVVQDTFIGLYVRWAFLRDTDAAVAYLNRAVVNGGRTELRRTRRALLGQLRLVPRSEATESAEGQALVHDRSDQLWQAVTHLPRRQRQVMLLRYYLDQSEAEIADVLGVSCGSVKQHTSRAMTALARRMEDAR